MRHACIACLLMMLASASLLAQSNPVPFVNLPLVPDATSPGGAAFTLTVNGTGFVSGSVINWNGSPLTTTFVSQSQLTATVPAANIANPTTASITVSSPGTPASNVQFFSVFNPIVTLSFSNYTDLFPYTELNLSPFTTGFVTGDFNGDGKLDVAATGNTPNNAPPSNQSLVILLGNGDGSFQTPIVYWDQQYYAAIVAGDFNGDGKLDVAAAPYNGPGAVFLGNGDGTFQPAKAFATNGPNSYDYWLAFTGDFNGDGNLDLALGYGNGTSSSGVAVFLGNGDGTFQNALDTPESDFWYPEAVGDFNGDGKLDIAGVGHNDFGPALFILLGNGDGTFQSPLIGTAPFPTGVYQIVTADFNGDGMLDLAILGNGSGGEGVWIQLGNGDGTFRAQGEYGGGIVFSTYITAVDLNADGKVDLATSYTLSAENLLVLLNNGDGTFQTPLSFPASAEVFLPGDFNGDGRMDMAWPPSLMLSGSFPVASLAPYPVAFPQVTFGNSSAPQNVTLTNTGPATLTLSGISLTGADVADFAQNNNCGATLAPNASCQIAVTFTPTTLGTRSAAVRIADNAPGTPQIVPLSGFSSGPAVTFSPSGITFPGQYVGTSGLPQSVQILNSGNAVLNISSVATNPTADFGPVDSCGNSLAVGATCSIAVFFDPAASGQVTGTLTVTDNAVGSPQIVTLSGAGQDFSLIAGSNPSATVKPGETAKYSVAVMPAGGFKQTVALSCSGAPADSTCSLSPNLIMLDGSKPSMVEVSITTAGTSAALMRPFAVAMCLAFSGIAGFMVFAGVGGRGRFFALTLLLLLSAAMVMTSCGGGTMTNSGGSNPPSGGTPGTAQGTYSILVTGSFSSGSSRLAHSAKLTLIVQ
ncbi:MAG TPA: FG-GAP-like repeat-containing protein [Terriglobales bacterium]